MKLIRSLASVITIAMLVFVNYVPVFAQETVETQTQEEKELSAEETVDVEKTVEVVEDADVITSCEDVVDTSTLGAYLGEYDGDPECLNQSEVFYLPTQNIFPGEEPKEVIRIQIDGQWYHLEELPNFTQGTITNFEHDGMSFGMFQGMLSLPHNFPNWPDAQGPSRDEPINIELTYHTSCETILSSAAILGEYLQRFNPETSLYCGAETESSTLSIQDAITIEKGSDLVSQLTFTFDGTDYTSADLTFATVLDGFTSENTGVFTVSVGAAKDGVSVAEDVEVTVIDSSEPQESIVTVVADMIICEEESLLPNWGNGGPNITASSAADFIAANEGCVLAEGRLFQWGDATMTDGGDATIGEVLGWTTTQPTDEFGRVSFDVNLLDLEDASRLEFRQVLEDGDIVFTHEANGNNSDNVSAELYCHEDVTNYDNWDWIRNIQEGSTYYCIGFNVAAEDVQIPNRNPELTLVGDVSMTITQGDTFTEPGYEAFDQEDGDITGDVVVGGDVVDTNTPGVYVITYNVTDSQGLAALEATRTVTVEEGESEEENNNGNGGGTTGGSSGGGIPSTPTATVIGGGEVLGATDTDDSEGEVLGASDVIACDPFVTYMKYGSQGGEVVKLQGFLNQVLGGDLAIDGVYGTKTMQAVSTFQSMYSDKILGPWGNRLSGPTGNFLWTTRAWANEMMDCGEGDVYIPALDIVHNAAKLEE